MPKKTIKSSSRQTSQSNIRQAKANNDFHFIVIMSVFAALTIFAASYVSNVRKEAVRAQKAYGIDVAELDIIEPTPLPWPSPRINKK